MAVVSFPVIAVCTLKPMILPPLVASLGVLASVVGVMGTLQAHEALKCLSGVGEVLYGKLLLWEADMLTWRTLKFSKDPTCPVCGNVNNEVKSMNRYATFGNALKGMCTHW
jgi:molybdopterin/thiamine biosynthesis adenylyltransferase